MNRESERNGAETKADERERKGERDKVGGDWEKRSGKGSKSNQTNGGAKVNGDARKMSVRG